MSCLSCGSTIIGFLDLGKMAFANAFLDRVDQIEEKESLEVGYCIGCHLVQLMPNSRVDPEKLFLNYVYTTSTSPQLHKHFEQYAEEIASRYPNLGSQFVVEIAANDGLFIKCLRNKGIRNVLGIDPAINVVKVALEEGFDMECGFFGYDFALKVESKHGKAQLIIANNVLAHTPNPNEILKAVCSLLKPDGVFVCEVQHLKSLVDTNEWTNIYHEHFSYFSLLSINKLFEQCGLHIFDVVKVNTQGGSLRIWASKKNQQPSIEFSNILEAEQVFELNSLETFENFGLGVKVIRSSLVALLDSLREKGKKLIGYGAPAKGNTLLQYCNIDSNVLDYITDESLLKQNRYTPGTHILVSPRNRIFLDTPNYILLLAWNYEASIIARESWFTDIGGKFITTVPYPKVLGCI